MAARDAYRFINDLDASTIEGLIARLEFRGKDPTFTQMRDAYLAQLAPHIAEGLRKALLLGNAPSGRTPDGPGVLILTEDLSTVATTASAEYWLMELTEAEAGDRYALPRPVRNVIAGLAAIERGLVVANRTPKVRLRTRSGHWLVLYASRLRSSGSQAQISVIFEIAGTSPPTASS